MPVEINSLEWYSLITLGPSQFKDYDVITSKPQKVVQLEGNIFLLCDDLKVSPDGKPNHNRKRTVEEILKLCNQGE